MFLGLNLQQTPHPKSFLELTNHLKKHYNPQAQGNGCTRSKGRTETGRGKIITKAKKFDYEQKEVS